MRKLSPSPKAKSNLSIAVLLPCYNEGKTIFDTVTEFQTVLPYATIYVYDNNSTDNTISEAERAGAVVRKESFQGKGYVVRRMFREIDSDLYVMADGDLTYPAEYAPQMINKLVSDGCDMIVGSRLDSHHHLAFRHIHKFGNNLISAIISRLFSHKLYDVLSGYRVFNRRFVQNVPLRSKRFEIETEITLNALEANMLIEEFPVDYRTRPTGSFSKLSTFKDGFLIIGTILNIFRHYKPLPFFSALSIFCALAGLLSGTPVVVEFAQTGIVRHIPLAILAASLEIMAIQFMSISLVLDSQTFNRKLNIDLKHRQSNLTTSE